MYVWIWHPAVLVLILFLLESEKWPCLLLSFDIHQVRASLYVHALQGTQAMVMGRLGARRSATSVRPTTHVWMDIVWWVLDCVNMFSDMPRQTNRQVGRNPWLGIVAILFTSVITGLNLGSWLQLHLWLWLGGTKLWPEYQWMPEQPLSEWRNLHWCH